MNKRSILRSVLPLMLVMFTIGMISACKQSPKNTGNEKTAMNEGMSAPATATFTAELSGANEVPPVTTNAAGMVTVNLKGDSIHVSGHFSGLSGTFTGSHIHMGARGSNGGVIQALDPDIESDSTSGSWDQTKNTFLLSQDQIDSLKSGKLYINVHSVTNKGGEIRGQLTAPADTSGSGSM